MKAIPVFRTFPALLAASALLLGCEAQHPIAAPDELQPHFAKGGKPGGGPNAFVPIPIDLEVTGGYVVTANDHVWIVNETDDVLGFGTQDAEGDTIFYSVNFLETADWALADDHWLNSCASKYGNNRHNGPILQADAERLIGYLRWGSELPPRFRWGFFHGSIDKLNLGIPSENKPGIPSVENHFGTRPIDNPANQHVGLNVFPTYDYYVDQGLLPAIDPPIVELISDDGRVAEYKFTGGIVQMHNRSSDGYPHATLQCPNQDAVFVTITRK